MTCILCDRVEKTSKNQYGYLIREFPHSYLYLGEHQYYRGYCVLVSKKHYREMTDIPSPEQHQFFSEMMESHQALLKAFSPKKMNMCSLGNVVDHLHWHFFPRYDYDPNFKNPPWLQMNLFENAKTSEQERVELIDLIRSNLKK